MSNLMKDYQAWKKKYNQHGRQAFSRYMMLRFLEGLNQVSDDYVFKGGNLLWHYIQTPRETTDLDLSTLRINSHETIRSHIEESFKLHKEIRFHIKDFKKIDKDGHLGAAITLSFETDQGQKNEFQIDIVYALQTDVSEVASTLGHGSYQAASIENIIADKVAAAHRFRSGNTRLKDFDDLWRIANSDVNIDVEKLKNIFSVRGIELELPVDWATSMEKSWKRHSITYSDLPDNIKEVFEDINSWFLSFN